MQMRSHSIEAVKIAGPAPSLPSWLDAGTSQSSNDSSAIGEVRSPILCSLRLMLKPGVPFSTMNAEMPAGPFAGSEVANTITMSA